jgi:hypothetical protein
MSSVRHTRPTSAYLARRATVADHAKLRALGIIMGSGADDTLIMRACDWTRALEAKAVRLLDPAPTISAADSSTPPPLHP